MGILAVVLVLLTLVTAPANAATGALYASGVTSPGGSVWLGSHLWVADHALGFCRVDGGTLNQNTCNLAATSPGQPTFRLTNATTGAGVVFVPDNSSKSQGVWRPTFDPATQTVGTPVLLANGGGGLAGNKATATALGPDGKLYVGFLKNGGIVRITNPLGAPANQAVQPVGKTSDGRGVSGLAFVGGTLYIAESGAVAKIAGAANCAGGCAAGAVTSIAVTAPMAIAAGGGYLYVADQVNDVNDASTILRFSTPTACPTGITDIYATKAGTASFQFVSSLGLDAAGNLYVGDDPTGGVQILQGHIWQVAPPGP